MLPSILTELDQLMLVQELNAKLFNKKIDAGLLRQCLNTPAACLEDDYQRLELLGDAFLKYVVSVWCFVAMDKVCHEGELHHTRLTMINNAALFRAVSRYLMTLELRLILLIGYRVSNLIFQNISFRDLSLHVYSFHQISNFSKEFLRLI